MFEWTQAFFFFVFLTLPGTAVFPFVHSAVEWGATKWLGLLTYAWVIWLGTSMKLLILNSATIQILFFAFVGTGFLILVTNENARALWKRQWRSIILHELAALVLFLGFILLQGVLPNFHYADRLHDYGFIMSAFHATSLPPPDPFLAPENINYYYFGHYVVALTAKLTGIPVELSFTCIMGYFFSTAALVAFSFSKHVYLRLCDNMQNSMHSRWAKVAGMIGAGLALFSGNAQPLEFALSQGPSNFDRYWYTAATLLVPKTRMDIPFFTFVNNELHAHSLNLVNSIVVLTLILRLTESTQRSHLTRFRLLALLALTLGAAYLTHAWDFAAHGILLGLAMLFGSKDLPVISRLLRTFLYCSGALLGAILLYLPFWLTFVPFGKGIALVPSVERSSLSALALHWGLFLVILSIWLAMARVTRTAIPPYVRALGLFSLLLLLLPEFIYIVDIHEDAPRFNTMWRCAFQGWITLACLAGATFVWTWRELASRIKVTRRVGRIAIGVVPMVMAIYPLVTLGTVLQRHPLRLQTLAVTYQLRQQYPEDMAGIDWLAARSPSDWGVVAEACGDNYTDHSRVAALTGMPTILGWSNIERQTRKVAWHEPIRPPTTVEKMDGEIDTLERRTRDVRTLYETNNPENVRKIVKRYQVRYIFVGTLERMRYADLNEMLLVWLYGEPVFEVGTTRVYSTLRPLR